MYRKRIDLNKVCKDYGIRVSSYAGSPRVVERLNLDPSKTPGLAFRTTDGTPAILYQSDRPALETRFTVSHELAHILLGHLDYRKSVRDAYPDFAESEANYFAVAMLVLDIICTYGLSEVKE